MLYIHLDIQCRYYELLVTHLRFSNDLDKQNVIHTYTMPLLWFTGNQLGCEIRGNFLSYII